VYVVSVYNAGIICDCSVIVLMIIELCIRNSMKGCRRGLIEVLSRYLRSGAEKSPEKLIRGVSVCAETQTRHSHVH
jgi:hypothetical protein